MAIQLCNALCSVFRDYHTKIKSNLIKAVRVSLYWSLSVFLLLQLTVLSASAQQISLAWDAPTTWSDATPLENKNLVGYYLYWGTSQNGPYNKGSAYVEGANSLQATVDSSDGIKYDVDYYFVVRALSDRQTLSVNSNETTGRVDSPFVDSDNDGVSDSQDNCPNKSNANQENHDGDSQGDACDKDDDNDGTDDSLDCLPFDKNAYRTVTLYVDADRDGYRDANTNSKSACIGSTVPKGFTLNANAAPGTDKDSDGIEDSKDNCPSNANPDQANYDGDSKGDVCDSDIDNDGVSNSSDCADYNSSAYKVVTLYQDHNHDGYRDDNTSGEKQCVGKTIPFGFTLNSATALALNTDSDGDGLTDEEEKELGTDPNLSDSDNDQVDDGQELLDGSNPLDSGSALPMLDTTVCIEWNGFLNGMWNILEHVNTSSKKLSVKTTLYSINGEKGGSTEFSIEPGAQTDILVHDLAGHIANSYGKVCSTHNGAKGDLNGRMVYYKTADSRSSDAFQFAFAMSMTNGKKGAQFVPFNTYQPSLSPSDSSNLVANWIQVTNLSESSARGTLAFYNIAGDKIGEQEITISAGARQDVSGHQFGSNLVGIVSWVPDNSDIPFQVRNVRYLYDNPTGLDSFDTAFQLEASKGSGELLSMALDTNQASSIVEISNTSASAVEVELNIYSEDGTEKHSQKIDLEPYASYHFIADEVLGLGQRGVATVKGSETGSIIAVAMHYGRRADLGIEYMYGIAARQALGGILSASYNTFLGQDSEIVIVNPTNEEQTVDVTLKRFDETVVLDTNAGNSSLSIPAKGTINLSTLAFENSNNYGVISVIPASGNSVTGWVLRRKGTEFVIPSEIKQ